MNEGRETLHSNLVIFKFVGLRTITQSTDFTFQSGYIQIGKQNSDNGHWILYIPIWLYSNSGW